MEEDFSWLYPPSSNRHGRNSKQKQRLKERLIERDGHRCKICKTKKTFRTLTIDHIIRVRDGGSWNIDNLRLTCEYCNSERA